MQSGNALTVELETAPEVIDATTAVLTAHETCPCGDMRVWTKYGWLCLHCDLNRIAA